MTLYIIVKFQPVYLRVETAMGAGMLNCCTSEYPQKLCFHMLPDCCSNYLECERIITTPKTATTTPTITTATNHLHAIKIEHDPYTPDSMDSPSPSAFPPASDIEIQEFQEYDQHYFDKIPKSFNLLKRHNSAVSPILLKSKLELIVKNNENAEKEKEKNNTNDYRLHSWPASICTPCTKELRNHRCNSDVSWQKSWIKKKHEISSSSDSSPDNYRDYCINIPRISIITASNFQSNESSVHVQDDKLSMILNKFDKSLNTSGNGSSFETDISQDRCDFSKTSSKISGALDSGLDTLDVDDGISQSGGSMGLLSNETTSIFPSDHEKDEQKLDEFLLISDTIRINDDCQEVAIDNMASNETLKNSSSSNEKISLKEYKLSQSYHHNIVNKNRKCCKCCCVIS